MTTIKSLHEDLLYTILSKCSSSIDIWHLLLALDYELTRMINLRAFWSHIRLTSLHNKNILLPFAKEIGGYCVDLRIDNLNWMITSDLRRLLAYFRSLVYFHSGNVSLSKSTLINDIPSIFPFLKSISLLISLEDISSIQDDNLLQNVCTSLKQLKELEYLSLVLQDKKGGYLSNPNARMYFQIVCEYISNLTNEYKLISIEENGYELKNRFLTVAIPEKPFLSASIDLPILSTLKHLIISFRATLNINLTLQFKDFEKKKLQLQTLVLPYLPSISNSINILDFNQLQILDIGYINVKHRIELTQLDDILVCHRKHSLRNLTISLNEWQPARLIVIWRKENQQQTTTTTTQISSVFEDCFTETEENEKPVVSNETNIIDEFSLEFLDDTHSLTFQLPLYPSWLNKLTNLNLTGIHCHSADFQHLFNSLHVLRSLSLSPCLLIYIDQFDCHCQTFSSSFPYQIHSLNRNLLSLNLISHISNPKEICSIFFDQYKLHSIRHSSIHQYLPHNQSQFQYESLFRYSIQTIFKTLDLHHLSIRMPNCEFHIDDFLIEPSNYLETLVLDVKIPLTFHIKLAQMYSQNIFNCLRKFILISENNFELTAILIDRFSTLEIIEIIAVNYHLKRTIISYLEKVLKPKNYPNLNTFRLWIRSVDAKHLLKHVNKTIRTAFENLKPAFIFDISIFNPLYQTKKSILYDNTHEIHRNFHSVSSIHSHQLSITYPNFLNYKPLYSERNFHE